MGYLDTLNEMQREAVITTEGPVLILAGAGSGKTRVLVHRVAYMIDQCGVNPWNILAITFTNKAAGEMRSRVNDIVGQGADSVWVSTFHSMCVRILRRHIDLIGFDTNFTIYDTDDQKTVMKDVLKRLNIDSKVLKERTALNAISNAKDEMIDPDEYEENASGDWKQMQIAKAYREYQETLRRSNALDFDDIICKTIELFAECPQVLDNYQERFRYIMVDEYQDTNTAQFELISQLAAKYRNLCVVGDDDQSIYKFRGANISNILDFEKIYKEARVIKLEQNYRSTQTILDAANAVISNNTARKSKALWTDNGDGDRIHFRQMDNAYEEAEYIADEIGKAVRKGKYSYGQCAVLYRTNAQSRIIEEAFVKQSMPYNVVGGVNFYSRKEIKDILAYLKTIDNAVDDVAVKRIINVPKRGIGQTTIGKVSDYANIHGISFYDALCQAADIPGLGKAALKLDSFTTTIGAFRTKNGFLTIKELIKDVLDITGYIDELKASDEEDADERIENIDELINKAADFDDTADEPSLSNFLADVALVADIDRLEEGSDVALLMTLHGAKGLEFEKVFIAGAEDGVFPSISAIFDEDPTAVEEERRLAYVGITRAKEDLTITCAKQRMMRGETQFNAVSRFVREIPENLLDNKPLKERRYDREEYDEHSSERVTFKTKPYGGGYSGYSGYGSEERATSGYSGYSGYGMQSGVGRPKPIVKPKITPEDKKPFISKGVGALAGGGISKGAAQMGELDYGIGDRVSHVKYGAGTVEAISKEPRDYKVTVEFDACGRKIMYAAFAKLKKI
ncbi:MAG: UvrD-helicase domain-containing protein [Lachnospiraceae bacterium]|nr:UvrD-helicase domain-containing protein [Candidatus Colinaster scatohippi]